MAQVIACEDERTQRIVDQYRAGELRKVIAYREGLDTAEDVDPILRRAGVPAYRCVRRA